MPKIGTVEVQYSRSMQPKQYESAQSSVKLSLVFSEDETPDVDEVISEELARVQAHVETALGIGGKPKAAPANKAEPKPATAEKPKPAPKAEKKADPKPKPPAPGKTKPAAPAKAAEESSPEYSHDDAMKAITETMTSLQKKGISDAPKRIEKTVRAYLETDIPPFSYTRVPVDSIPDFIKDVQDLANVSD